MREISGARVLKAIRWLRLIQVTIENPSIAPLEEVCTRISCTDTLTEREKKKKGRNFNNYRHGMEFTSSRYNFNTAANSWKANTTRSSPLQ